ncbi:hypothetical protein NCCP2495_27680 [Dietzia sp. NCCP-2495]|nr:hypothetical protein NCCP2495_27680 [Dietzia sp. NCCP-2495]
MRGVGDHREEGPSDDGAPAGPVPEPEVWRLDHPDLGVIEVAVGATDTLRLVDEGFPRLKSGADEPTTPGCVVLEGGEVVARIRQIGNHRVALESEPPAHGEFTTVLTALSGPRVQLRSSTFSGEMRQVTFRDGSELVHFDPPPDSAAEARLDAIAASPWKRVVYPLAAGVGKSGWAIAMILLLPLLRPLFDPVIDWIAERMPDIDIPWPDISLPAIPWPDITLPAIDLPAVELPGWVEFLLEYSKVWVPLVIGVALAVLAVRHSRKSQRIKDGWKVERDREHRAADEVDERE